MPKIKGTNQCNSDPNICHRADYIRDFVETTRSETLDVLAKKVGCSKQTIGYFLNGRCTNIDTVIALLNVMGYRLKIERII